MGKLFSTSWRHRLTPLVSLVFVLAVSAAHAQENNASATPSSELAKLIQQSQENNVQRRDEAAIALMRLDPPPPEAIAAMRMPLISDPVVQKAMANGGQQAVATLSAALHNSNQNVRFGAVNILASMARQRPQFWPLLIDAFRNDDAAVRNIAANQVAYLWYLPGADQRAAENAALQLLRKALKDDDPRVRSAALYAVSGLRNVMKDAAPELSLLVKDSDPAIRSSAINLLSIIGPPAKDAVANLLAALKGPDTDNRRDAAVALAHIDPHHNEVMPILIEALGPQSNGARGTVVDALGAMGAGARDAAPTLEHLLATNKDDSQMRAEIVKVLPQVAGKRAAAAPLARALSDDTESQVRQDALESIVGLGADGAVAIPALVKSLGDNDEMIRFGAFRALTGLGKLAVPALTAALDSPDLYVRRGAIDVLGHDLPLPDDAIRALTAHAFNDKSRSVRDDAAGLLSEAKVNAGNLASARLQKEEDAAAAKKIEENKRPRSREEIIATVPADADHKYPMRLESMLPVDDSKFLVTLHHGEDRPDRLVIWKEIGDNQYLQLDEMDADPDMQESFRPPTLIVPEGQPSGEKTQFLYIIKDAWRHVDDILFAVDEETDELHPVEIESPEEWYQSKLRPSEGISVYSGNDIEDGKEPGFGLALTNPKDPTCCPSAGKVTGTYKIIKEMTTAKGSGQPREITWKFVPATAIRTPMPPR